MSPSLRVSLASFPAPASHKRALPAPVSPGPPASACAATRPFPLSSSTPDSDDAGAHYAAYYVPQAVWRCVWGGCQELFDPGHDHDGSDDDDHHHHHHESVDKERWRAACSSLSSLSLSRAHAHTLSHSRSLSHRHTHSLARSLCGSRPGTGAEQLVWLRRRQRVHPLRPRRPLICVDIAPLRLRLILVLASIVKWSSSFDSASIPDTHPPRDSGSRTQSLPIRCTQRLERRCRHTYILGLCPASRLRRVEAGGYSQHVSASERRIEPLSRAICPRAC